MRHTHTIGAILDALSHPEQQHPQLAKHLHPLNHEGYNYQLDHHTLRVSLAGESSQWVLIVPLGEDFGIAESQIRERCKATQQLPYLAEAHFISSALTLFDQAGEPHTRPAILQQSATPLEEFIRLGCSTKHRPRLRRALEYLAHSAEALSMEGLRLGNLSRRRICFDSECRPLFADYPLSEGTRSDIAQLCQAALLLFVAACQVESYQLLTPKSTTLGEHHRRLGAILSAAEYYAIKPLVGIAENLLRGAYPEALLGHLEELVFEPFRPLPRLTELLSGKETFATNQPTSTVDSQALPVVNFALCEEVLPAGEELVRYRLGGLWGYAQTNGKRLPLQRTLLYAEEFAGSRAMVKTSRGYGVIDTEGRVVVNDVWSDLGWHPEEGIITASDTLGKWHILDPQGRQLTAQPSDWLGCVAEGFVVARKGNKFGYYSTSGQKMTDFIYDEAYGFINGLALVAHNGNHYHIDDLFHRLASPEEKFIQRFRGMI